MKTQKLAIATITIGEKFWKMAFYTHPLIKEYAKKCGADFIVLDSRKMYEKCGLATYERFQLYELFDTYDRIAFIDTDILVSPDSPSIFELTPPGKIGACSEELYSQSARDKDVTQEVLGKVDWKNVYFNAGMILLDKSHKELLNPDSPGLTHWAKGDFRENHLNLLNDQPFINHRSNLLGYDVHDLGHRFNHTRVIHNTSTRFNSYFIHYAGPSGHRYGERIDQIRKDSIVLHSKIRTKLSRKYPIYRWFCDRLDIGFIKYLVREKLKKQLRNTKHVT